MCRAGKVLKEIYSNLLHVTCLAHLMHNCALKVKSFCKEVDDLIAAVKASVVKNKSRAADFDVYGRPPQPVVTRWGVGWMLQTTMLRNFRKFKKFSVHEMAKE